MYMVRFDKRDRIAHITLNRPDALNALDDQLNNELAQCWTELSNDDSVDVAILTGEGRAFCAGADLKSFIPKWENATPLDLRENSRQGLGGGITRGKHRIYKPIIAAINGIAVGAGFELALAADIRIASTQAKFGVFEVRYGLHQGDGGLVRLLAIAGLGTAIEAHAYRAPDQRRRSSTAQARPQGGCPGALAGRSGGPSKADPSEQPARGSLGQRDPARHRWTHARRCIAHRDAEQLLVFGRFCRGSCTTSGSRFLEIARLVARNGVLLVKLEALALHAMQAMLCHCARHRTLQLH